MAKSLTNWITRNLLAVALGSLLLVVAGCGGGDTGDISGVKKVQGLEVMDLGTLGGDSSRATGMNAKGEIVGTSSILPGSDTLSEMHAFLWRNGEMTDLGSLTSILSGFSFTVTPTAVNDAGQVVGSAYTPYGLQAFIWQNGAWSELGLATAGFDYCTPTKINNKGQVIGHCGKLPEFGGHGFFWENGVVSDLGAGIAADINQRGQVAGTILKYVDGVDVYHAFLWQNGEMTDLGTLDASASAAGLAPNLFVQGINDRGQIVGTIISSSGGRAFLWDDGVLTDLGTLSSGTSSYATAVNDSGQAIGMAGTPSGNFHGFIWFGGVMTDLGVLPDRTSSYPVALNDRGQVIGYCSSFSTPSNFLPDLGFVWGNGVMTELKGVDGSVATPVAINNRGDVAGNTATRAVVWNIK